MIKKTVFLGVVLLSVSTVASAASFWAAIMWTPSNSSTSSVQIGSPPSIVAGTQTATSTGSGSSLVIQGAAGVQDSDSDSQEQGMIAGQGQIVANSGQGTAIGSQAGIAGQTQTTTIGSGTAKQSQFVGGIQYGTVTGTNSGSQGTVVQVAVVQIYQFQSF